MWWKDKSIFFKVLFLLRCWTLRGECTFRSDQRPSNSYLKESQWKPWSSYKTLDCPLTYQIYKDISLWLSNPLWATNCPLTFSFLLTVEVNTHLVWFVLFGSSKKKRKKLIINAGKILAQCYPWNPHINSWLCQVTGSLASDNKYLDLALIG